MYSLSCLSIFWQFELVSKQQLAQNGKNSILNSFKLWGGGAYGGEG